MTHEQALEHLAAAIAYLRNCSPTEAEPSAKRCFQLMSYWLQGPTEPPRLSLFDAKGYCGTIQESGQVYGLCPHHLVPYHGSYQLNFQPGSTIVGLSSISRVVDHFCRRALLQESLTQELGQFFYQQLQPQSLEFRISARHFCKEMQPINHSRSTQDFVTCWKSPNWQ